MLITYKILQTEKSNSIGISRAIVPLSLDFLWH